MVNINDERICDLEINIARLEEKIIASDKALELAKHSMSISKMTNIITIVTTIVGFIILIIRIKAGGNP